MNWIFQNRSKLKTKLIVHLGAVINILTGRLKRAPRWMQLSGLEWLWRIFQEPLLYRRYLKDGIFFIGLFLGKIVPLKCFLWRHKKEEERKAPPKIWRQRNTRESIIVVEGVCNRNHRGQYREAFEAAANDNREVAIDLRKADYVDSSFLGSLLLFWREMQLKGKEVRIIHEKGKILKIFRLYMLVNFLTFEKNSKECKRNA